MAGSGVVGSRLEAVVRLDAACGDLFEEMSKAELPRKITKATLLKERLLQIRMLQERLLLSTRVLQERLYGLKCFKKDYMS